MKYIYDSVRWITYECNLEWFNRKREEFKQVPNYHKKNDCIILSDTHRIYFESFLLDDIASKIIDVIKPLFSQLNSIHDKDKFLDNVNDIVENRFAQIQEYCDDKEFKIYMKKFLNIFIQHCNTHFYQIKELNNFINQNENKLVFTISQEELVVLISILHKAEILDRKNGDYSIINKFIQRYFYFTNSKTNEITQAIDFPKKFSRYNAGESSSATKDRVKDILLKALK